MNSQMVVPTLFHQESAPWRRCNLPVLQEHPGILCGAPVTIIPFGGSINNNDRLSRLSSSDNGVGKYLIHQVRLGLLGIEGAAAIGQNSMSPNLTQKDSSMLGRDDMQRLKEEIELCDAPIILVAMGLGRATEVGNYLRQNLSEHVREHKLIVMTGSHDLFSQHPGDSRFNLGYAQGYRFSAERGVRIALHCGLFKPEEIGIQLESRGVFFLADADEDRFSPLAPNTLIIGMGGTIEGQELSVQQKFQAGFCENYIREQVRPKQMPTFFDIAVAYDSRELTVQHINKLKATILGAQQTELVVTVGTFGAEVVGTKLREDSSFMQALHEKGKKVVFAVAMNLPTEQHSDAFYNLGFALSAVRHVAPGLYLSVHGLVGEIGSMSKINSGKGGPGPYFAPRR
ncbi:MAG: asparaginase domain-containing protein [Pseudomonadota bacterium]